MTTRGPQSAASLPWRITPYWAARGMRFFSWPAGGADANHVLLTGDVATRLGSRAASGAAFDAATGRVTGNSTVDFTFGVSGGFGGMTEQSNAYFGASYFGSFPGGKGNPAVNMFSSDPTIGVGIGWHAGGSAGSAYDIVGNIQNSSYVSPRDTANGTPDYYINTQGYITAVMRYQTDDPISKLRLWYTGVEAIARRSNPSAPSATTAIGTVGRPVVFGGSYALDANTKLEWECAFYGAPGGGTVPSAADMAALAANPFIAIEATPAATSPGAPTIGAATSASIGSVSVAGTAPASDGGAAITLYTATSSLGETATSATLPVTFTGLSAVARTFHLQATNSVNISAASAESNSVTPMAATVPAAPSLGTATAGSTQATFPFTVNANGGSAILDTTVTLSPGGATGTYTGSGSGSITVVGLTNGQAYTATAKSRNTIGPSVASTVSNSVTPSAANAVPTFPGPNIADIAGTQNSAIATVDVSAKFTDAGDTKTYSKSPAGTTWPTGVSIDATTGIISGTPTSSGTTTGCKVRDTDSVGQVVDSNAFNVVIAAAASGTFVTGQWCSSNTVRANQAYYGTWFSGGVLGSVAGTATFRSGTLDANGAATLTGLPSGPGIWNGATADNGRYYQEGTVA